MFIKVIHKAFEETPYEAARVEAVGKTVDECLEYAYRYTQNIEGSWSIKDGNADNNGAVTVLKDLYVDDKGKTWGHRSTSVNDIMQIEGSDVQYRVAGMGFERV